MDTIMGVTDKTATMSPPAQREIQAVLGLAEFWRMHVTGYSELVSSALYQVTQKKCFESGLEQHGFEQIKQKTAPVVALGPGWTGPAVQNILLHCS